MRANQRPVAAWRIAPTSVFSDFDVQVRARIEGAALDKIYGLNFRYTEGGNFYVFEINPGSGSYRLIKQERGTWASIIDFTPSPHIFLGTTPNVLRVIARVSEIELYANDHWLATVVDDTFTSGGIGLIVTQGTDPNETGYFFDDLIVRGEFQATPSPTPSAIDLQSPSKVQAAPWFLLDLTASGFDPDADLHVRFLDVYGYSVDVPVVSSDSTSLTVAVPPIIDLETGKFGAGVAGLQLVQESTTGTVESNTVFVEIDDMPPSAGPIGTVTLAYFDAIIQLFQDAMEHLIILDKFAPGEEVNIELFASIDGLRDAYIGAKKELEAVIADPSKSIEFAESGDDTLELNITAISIMDRIIGSVVQQVLASLAESAATGMGKRNSELVASKQESAQIVPINFLLVQAQPDSQVQDSLSLRGRDLASALLMAKT